MPTKKPIDALESARRMIKNMPLERLYVDITNDVLQRIWMEAPWAWTLDSFPIVNLVVTHSDYAVSIPDDFLYLADASVVTSSSNRDVEIVATLPTNIGISGQPSQICVLGNAGEEGILRISPKPISSTEYIKAIYKKTYSPYDAHTIYTTALPFPDEWYHVFQAGVLWLAYKYADDTRAGECSARSDGSMQFNGHRGQFEADLFKMRNREPLILANDRNVKDPKLMEK